MERKRIGVYRMTEGKGKRTEKKLGDKGLTARSPHPLHILKPDVRRANQGSATQSQSALNSSDEEIKEEVCKDVMDTGDYSGFGVKRYVEDAIVAGLGRFIRSVRKEQKEAE